MIPSWGIISWNSQEAIKQVPGYYMDAALALGATKWQAVVKVILPQSIPGIVSGFILAMSRAIGESAPMIAISALVYITFLPEGPLDRFTVMPIQIYNWISQPQDGFRGLAAAGIILLLIMLLSLNSLAIFLRDYFQRRNLCLILFGSIIFIWKITIKSQIKKKFKHLILKKKIKS